MGLIGYTLGMPVLIVDLQGSSKKPGVKRSSVQPDERNLVKKTEAPFKRVSENIWKWAAFLNSPLSPKQFTGQAFTVELLKSLRPPFLHNQSEYLMLVPFFFFFPLSIDLCQDEYRFWDKSWAISASAIFWKGYNMVDALL